MKLITLIIIMKKENEYEFKFKIHEKNKEKIFYEVDMINRMVERRARDRDENK